MGPGNFIGRGYQGLPIAITVEGANILTRNLIIFGQGAIRCHPFLFKEMETVAGNDVAGFDEALLGHGSLVMSNVSRGLFHSLSGGRLLFADSLGLQDDGAMLSREQQLAALQPKQPNITQRYNPGVY